jgi:7,8-dihydroneopterin aldolase/epimerase/oxygenase
MSITGLKCASSGRMKGKIHLQGLVFFGYHGCHHEETKLGQRFIVDLRLTTDMTEAAAHDLVGHTVNYVEVYSLCRDIVQGAPVHLLETLCDRLLTAVLAHHPRVEHVWVQVKKPAVPIPGALDWVAVEAERSRG